MKMRFPTYYNYLLKINLVIIAGIISAVFSSCNENPPSSFDGNAKMNLVAVWDSSSNISEMKLAPLANAKVILSSEYGVRVFKTDANGMFSTSGLPSAKYSISVRMQHPDNPSSIIVGSLKDIEVNSGNILKDTILAKPISNTGIAINEIYAGGPVNSIFYFYDQFIELYNSSDSIKYLDGMMVMRVSGNNDGKGPGADEGDDGDIDGITYAFKFPGRPGEHNYPFYPNTFITLAQDAVNHKNTVSTSIDLSKADWEFYNQYSANDIDNPNVPNLLNMRTESTVDFMINLSSDVIVVSSGVDTNFVDGIDISTIIDGVEYQSSANSAKTLDGRVDKGFTLSPAKYSGKSMQRREPGGDTDDATLDWDIIPAPTPGYQ